MDKKFQILFSLYKNFLGVDAVTFLNFVGRNRLLIGEYFKVFSAIINKNENLFQESLKEDVRKLESSKIAAKRIDETIRIYHDRVKRLFDE